MVVWTNGGSLTNLGLGWVDSEWGLIRFLVVLKILLMVVRGYRLGLDLGGNCSEFGLNLDAIVQISGQIWWVCGYFCGGKDFQWWWLVGGGSFFFFFLSNFGGEGIGVFG